MNQTKFEFKVNLLEKNIKYNIIIKSADIFAFYSKLPKFYIHSLNLR